MRCGSESARNLPVRYVQFSDEQGHAAAEVIARLDAAGGRAHLEAEAAANCNVGTNLSKIRPTGQPACSVTRTT